MKRTLTTILSAAALSACGGGTETPAGFTGAPGEVKLITLDPGHFHAALVQKTAYPQVAPDVHVYAPAGDDLRQHIERIEQYNSRPDNPTAWNEIVYTGTDYLQKMVDGKRGNVMVVAGNNRLKTNYIAAAIDAGINVLADKPMAVDPANFELLKECFRRADEKGLLLYDIMTERHEITSILQRELAQSRELFGEVTPGTPDDPSIVKESVHHFSKAVSGVHLLRPAWFFDVEQQGDGIVDVTTHLIDLVQWSAFPDVVLDYTRDVEMVDANRWSTTIDPAQFKQVTGMDSWPDYLQKDVRDGVLHVFSNGDISYRLRGVNAKVTVVWNFEAPPGTGDTHYSLMRGSRAELIIRQGAEQNYTPTLYVRPAVGAGEAADAAGFGDRLSAAIASLAKTYPGLAVAPAPEPDGSVRIDIPARYFVGHEPHFGQVTEHYLRYLVDGRLPEWEVPGMIAKYYITSEGIRIAKAK
ncbi:MAG: Gfo/Idh/MocA family oxidoreductase [Alistipes sp.]|jgi:predicted dehydrogenase|nr:Gfo/Idh/MocA family oxidoreductase [Alistipes sp.]